MLVQMTSVNHRLVVSFSAVRYNLIRDKLGREGEMERDREREGERERWREGERGKDLA